MATTHETRRADPDTAGAPVPGPDSQVTAPQLLHDADLEAILDGMPVGVLIEDEQGSCWVNAELARLWRYESSVPPAASCFRRDLRAATEQEDPDGLVRAAFRDSLVTGRWRLHTLRRRDGTTMPVRVMRKAVRSRAGAALQATFVLESRHPELNARMRTALLAMLGHELRTPITSIVAGADLLQSARLEDPARDEITALLLEEAHRVNILIEQLTALTRLQSMGSAVDVEPVNLLHLARRVGGREARRRPGMQLQLPRLQSSGPIALGNEGFIAEVLMIMIDNAAKYAGAYGEVEVTVEAAGNHAAVHVLDRGPGLDGTEPARLFELFARATLHRWDGRGTGIGLYVASQIVAALRGRIWAANRPDGGADFGFALPLAHDSD